MVEVGPMQICTVRSLHGNTLQRGGGVLVCLVLAMPVACGSSLGQRWNPSHSSYPSRCSDNARSLTHCLTSELYTAVSCFVISYCSIVFVCLLFTATTPAYRSTHARRLIGATVAGLRHNHSNAESEPHLQPTPQLTATPDP